MKRNILFLVLYFTASVITAQTSGISGALLSPNPGAERVQLVFPEPPGEMYSVQVRDLTGRVWMAIEQESTSPQSRTMDMDLSGLPAGLYIFQVSVSSGKTRSIRFQRL